MKRVIAIGGGEISQQDTFEIDKYIVECIKKENPRLLFIPTASEDSKGYVKTIQRIFGKKLTCTIDTLELTRNTYTENEIRDKILSADIIYVGGGNTKNMLKIWRKNKVDLYLREAYENEILMSGLSAGAICWFEKGHSDSDTIASGEEKPFCIVDAMDWFPIILCPHHNEGKRAPDFDQKIVESNLIGLGLENCTAIEIVDDTFRILKSKNNANAYKIYAKNENIIKEELPCDNKYRKLKTLLV